MDLSIIVPIFNEEENISPLYAAITRNIQPLGLDYEIILVDDGSSDRSFEIIADFAHNDAHVRAVKLRMNCGQTAAMAAGIDFATGDILVTLDGDLQNDPADIPLMLDKLAEGYDLVAGWRRNRKDKTITRIIPSMIANALISFVLGVPLKDTGCTLKAFRAKAIKGIPLYNEMHRFIPAMTSLVGTRIAQIEVRHHPRRYGVSKYGLSRIYRVFLDLLMLRVILSFAARPIAWCGVLAFFWSILSLLFIVVVLFQLFGLKMVIGTGLALIFGALSFFFILLGFIMHLIYRSAIKRPDVFLRRAASTMVTVIGEPAETAQ